MSKAVNCRVLSLTLGTQTSSDGIASLATLQHLQEFTYHETDTPWNREKANGNKKFFAMCLQLLPRLRVSCSAVEIELELDNFLSDFASKAFRDLQGLLPSVLRLRTLALHNASEMPVDVALPELSTLTLVTPQATFQLGYGFSSVTELSLQGVRVPLLERILARLGRQLRKLSVLVWDTLFVDRVFRMCPELQVFYISQYPTHIVGLEAPLGHLALSCLTEFGFVVQSDQCCSAVRTDHLLQMLRAAPNLHVLHLKNVFFCDKDDEDIGWALEQRSILQNLEKLCCFYEWPELPITDEKIEVMESTYTVIYNIIVNCQKLFSLVVDTWG
jgi:hypothetical protein